jgi:hypothetical protein
LIDQSSRRGEHPESLEWRAELRQNLIPDIGAHFARMGLGHVMREYSDKLDHVHASAEDARAPSALHSVLFMAALTACVSVVELFDGDLPFLPGLRSDSRRL